jgi:hypothetical protein
MKTIKLSKTGLIFLLMLAVGAVSCSKKNSVSPSKKISYQLKVSNLSAPLKAGVHSSNLTTMSIGTGNITWESGFANVSSITFEGKNENDNNNNEEDAFTEPAPFKVDLFKTSPLLGNVDIAVGLYHNVDIKLDIKQTSTDPALFLKGTYSSANGAIPVEFSLDEHSDGVEILITAKDLSVGAKDHYVDTINLHLNKLMEGVSTSDLAGAALTNGVILINSTHNANIYSKIKANINNSTDSEFDN